MRFDLRVQGGPNKRDGNPRGAYEVRWLLRQAEWKLSESTALFIYFVPLFPLLFDWHNIFKFNSKQNKTKQIKSKSDES